jgi:outer membrane protein assembly factor BamE
MRIAVLAFLALALCGCELVYKLPTRQGNVLEQKELDGLELGMSREQVKFLLGTPIAASSFREDRWDYVGYYKNPRGKVFSRTVSLYFEGDNLVRMDGQKAPETEANKPDLESVEKEEKKAATEAERAKEKTDTGIVITPKK